MDERRDLPVQLQLSHPKDSELGLTTELCLIDVRSRVRIAVVRLDTRQFHELMASTVTENYPTASVAGLLDLTKVGLPRHRFTRVLGPIVHPDARTAAQAWIDRMREELDLHVGELLHHRYGYTAEWAVWRNLTSLDDVEINNRILTAELPEGLRR